MDVTEKFSSAEGDLVCVLEGDEDDVEEDAGESMD